MPAGDLGTVWVSRIKVSTEVPALLELAFCGGSMESCI